MSQFPSALLAAYGLLTGQGLIPKISLEFWWSEHTCSSYLILPILGTVSRTSYIICRVHSKVKMCQKGRKKDMLPVFRGLFWHIMMLFVFYLVSCAFGHEESCWVNLDPHKYRIPTFPCPYPGSCQAEGVEGSSSYRTTGWGWGSGKLRTYSGEVGKWWEVGLHAT